jgi:hypothetical protein
MAHIVLPSEIAEAGDTETAPGRLHQLAHYAALQVLVAQNPATPAKTLHFLLNGTPKKEVCEAVARNPNTPFEILLTLLPVYAEQVLENPALFFLLMENPALAAQLEGDQLVALLRFEAVPRAFLKRALDLPEGSDAHQEALMHVMVRGEVGPNWHDELLRDFGMAMHFSTSDEIFFEVPGLLPATLRENLLKRLTTHPFLALNPDLTPAMFAALRKDTISLKTWQRLAQNPATSPALLAQLSMLNYYSVNQLIALHPLVGPETLVDLAHNEYLLAREAVAMNPRTPTATLAELATDAFAEVRAAVAGNPAATVAICTLLASDPFSIVREQVAMHPQTPPELLAQLAEESFPPLHTALVRNPALPLALFERLAQEESPTMQVALAQSPLLTVDRAWRFVIARDSQVCEYVAANPALPTTFLERLAATTQRNTQRHRPKDLSRDDALKRGLARNPATPKAVLLWLAELNKKEINQILAGNPALPSEAQGRLVEDLDELTAVALARNPATALSLLARLGERGIPSPETERERRSHHLQRRPSPYTPDYTLFFAVVSHPAMNAATRHTLYARLLDQRIDYPGIGHWWLFALLWDPATFAPKKQNRVMMSWIDRYAVAFKSNTPKRMLEQLSHDGNRYVRAAARDTLAANHPPKEPI